MRRHWLARAFISSTREGYGLNDDAGASLQAARAARERRVCDTCCDAARSGNAEEDGPAADDGRGLRPQADVGGVMHKGWRRKKGGFLARSSLTRGQHDQRLGLAC